MRKEDRLALLGIFVGLGATVMAMALPLAYPDAPLSVWRTLFWGGSVIATSSFLFLIYDLLIRPRLISEQKKDKTAYQTELIKQWRNGIESIDDAEWYSGMGITFGDKPWYSSLRQYMKKEAIEKLEKPRTLIVPSEGRRGFPKKQILLDEVARIEKEQGLTGIH